MRISILIQTELGNIAAELYPEQAPITVANFLRDGDAGYYSGGRFWRTVVLHPNNQPNNQVSI